MGILVVGIPDFRTLTNLYFYWVFHPEKNTLFKASSKFLLPKKSVCRKNRCDGKRL